MKPTQSIVSLVGALALLLSPVTSGAEESLSGVYVYIQKTTSVTKMPVLSDVVATTTAVSVQQLSFDGEWLRGNGELCDVQMQSSSKLVRMTLPPAFRRSISTVVTNAHIHREGSTLTFRQPAQTLIIGADLEKHRSEALPSDPSDPRVRDDDQDGKPGVTVQVSGIISGEIYLVQRSTSYLEGHATSQGFHGTIHFTNEQSILDATKRVLKRNPHATPDPARSEFHLVKVDPKVGCTEARKMALGR